MLTVPIIPSSYQSVLLNQYHIQAGHLGPDKTATRIRQVGYWFGMLQDIDHYCKECIICQASKSSAPQKAPLINVPIGKPWEMVAVDILQVPLSSRNNQYLLVIQDYFTKWAEAILLPNQTANRITSELIRVFSNYGLPDILHIDQGRNFERSILRQTLEAFGIKKTRTTAYHPQGDGMVERFNRSLSQLLRAYVEHQTEWEQYLPFVLFAYHTAVHTSTGVSPFELMYGRPPSHYPFPSTTAYDAVSYQSKLRSKLSQLSDLVETHLTQAAQKQKTTYDQKAMQRSVTVGEQVWLASPICMAGKLDPKWEGSGKYNQYKDQRPTLSQMETELRPYMSTEFALNSSQHLCHQIQMDHQQKGTGKHHQWSITLLISMNLDHISMFKLEDPLIVFIFSSRTSLSWGRRM